jgi:multimeric flavodoxin WrbA
VQCARLCGATSVWRLAQSVASTRLATLLATNSFGRWFAGSQGDGRQRMTTVLLLVDGRPQENSQHPQLLPIVHAASRGVVHTGAQIRLFGLADSAASRTALANADIRELPEDTDELAEICAGVDAVMLGGATVRGAMAGTVFSALERLAALPGTTGLTGMVGSVFTCSTGTGVGGHEAALSAVHSSLLSCGALVCGVLPSPQLQMLHAATPSGVVLSPGSGKEQHDAACAAAAQQGQHVADVAAKLKLASMVANLRS